MHFVFVTGGSIRVASISKDQELSETDPGDTKSDNEGESTYVSAIFWYGNNYVLTGTQRIRNTENEDSKKKKTICFLSYQKPW